LVVDWGLARQLGRPERQAPVPDAPPPPPSDGPALTRVGEVVGTPNYMSPEQAAGQLDQLGPASDVYSLGAILSCLLTGQPPFAGLAVEAVLAGVRDGDLTPPAQLNRKVPAALSAVCARALALRPEDRYPSATALAEDVERWLADSRSWPGGSPGRPGWPAGPAAASRS
jgi:serine/threonine protein kinase